MVARPDGTQRRLLAPWLDQPSAALDRRGRTPGRPTASGRVRVRVGSRTGAPPPIPSRSPAISTSRTLAAATRPSTTAAACSSSWSRRGRRRRASSRTGAYHDHSPVWSPRGDEVAFLSNRAADPDRVFNYDVFAVAVEGGAVRRLTDTPSAEYAPSWSPDGPPARLPGTRRPPRRRRRRWRTRTSGGSTRGEGRPRAGRGVDNRQGPPRWSKDGRWLYFTVQERGDVRLYRLPAEGGAAEPVAPAPGPRPGGRLVVADDGTVAFALATPEGPAELMVTGRRRSASPDPPQRGAAGRARARPPSSPSASPPRAAGDRGLPHAAPGRAPASSRHPLIVAIHGGPTRSRARRSTPRRRSTRRTAGPR